MARIETCYEQNDTSSLPYKVTYLVKKSGVVLVRSSDSLFLLEKFVNKLKRSKTCVLISYPSFN